MNLPDSFTSSMKALLGSDYDRFIRSYEEKPCSGLRVNTSKISCEDFEKIAPFALKKIPFVTNGYYIDDTDAWSKHPYYYAGLYYLQEPSAMLPADNLPVKPGDKVCDLCAAPGGKSTQLSTLSPSVLLSNDISFSRTIPLVKNLEMFGCGNFLVSCTDPSILAVKFPSSFDAVLVDAPCSGEGMFRKDHGLISSYEKKGPGDYQTIQCGILDAAARLVKSGGYIMYSTCTFSDMEDEQVIKYILDKHKELSVIPLDMKPGMAGAYDKYSEDRSLSGIVHVFPHLMDCEGHFMALLKKEGQSVAKDHKGCFDKQSKLPDELTEFYSHFSEGFRKKTKDYSFNRMDDGFIYITSDDINRFIDPSVRYARTGTCIGNIRNGSFRPHTALALSMKADDFDNVIDLDEQDINVKRFLKGETILTSDLDKEPEKGYVLVCVNGYGLGFCKNDGSKLKNLYEKGWILR